MKKEIENEIIFLDHENLTLEALNSKIHEIISNDANILYKKGNINEWVTLHPKYLPSEALQKQYIEAIKYIDELMISLFDKMKYINTLSWMLMSAHIPIDTYDVGSLFLLTDYFSNVPHEKYETEFKVLGNKDILLITRYNTLDTRKRVGILKYIIDNSRSLDFNDNLKLITYIETVKNTLKTKKANTILEVEGYM